MKFIFYYLNLYLHSYIRSGSNRHSFWEKVCVLMLVYWGSPMQAVFRDGERTYCLCLHRWGNSPINPESETTEPTIRRFGIGKIEIVLGAVVLLRHLWVMSWPGPFSSQLVSYHHKEKSFFPTCFLPKHCASGPPRTMEPSDCGLSILRLWIEELSSCRGCFLKNSSVFRSLTH